MIKVAVLGYGNIGSGVVQVLLKNKETIAKKAGDEIVPACVLDLRDFPGDVMEDKLVKDINLIHRTQKFQSLLRLWVEQSRHMPS